MPRSAPPSLGEIGADFRVRFRERELLLGTFLKTPSVHATEILAEVGFDFLVIDQEHAPFDAAVLDHLAVASRAGGIPSLVRVADANPSRLLGVLDLGFAGVVVPHVSSVSSAKATAEACRFANGQRGFSPSCRAGKYGGRSIRDHMDAGDRGGTVIAMIEDMDAVNAIHDIVAVDGIDGFLIGRGDLAVSIGEPHLRTPRMLAAVSNVMDACREAERPVMFHLGDVSEMPFLAGQGGSAFLVSSDQGLLRTSAQQVQNSFRGNSPASEARLTERRSSV